MSVDLQTLIAGYMACHALQRLMSHADMDAMVVHGTWSTGTEVHRPAVQAALGPAFYDAAWERGKAEAWRAYADAQDGVWPTLPTPPTDERRAR